MPAVASVSLGGFTVTPGLIVLVAVIAIIEWVVIIWAIVDVLRHRPDQVLWGRRWVWVLISLVNVGGIPAGAIVWFVAGKKPTPASEGATARPATDRAAAAADALYGAPAPPVSPPAIPPAAPASPAAQTTCAPGSSEGQAPASSPESDAVTPESMTGDPEIGADGTGSGELP